ncbi:unnamed protein product [Lota lota]
MENLTKLTPLKQPIVFELESFEVAQDQGSVMFFLALLNYMVVLLANGLVIGIIVADRALHRPMNVLICNLAACDLMGGTAVLIRLMMYLATGQKRIAYGEAILQAFSVHTYGVAIQTILAAMAYDRYLAVCEPLRYHAIMTPSRLLFSCVLAWVVALLCIGVLFALNVGTPLCGTIIKHVYCSNRSILYLACAPTPINDIYGLCMTWSLSTGCFLVIAFSYIKILHACIKNSKDISMQSKAFQTCASHLVVYVIYQIGSTIIILTQRFNSVSPNLKKFCGILFIIIPPAVNPVIYGLVTKELRSSLLKLFKTKVTPRTPFIWMENLTKRMPLKQPIVFELESFEVADDQGPVLFFLALLNYMVVLLANGLVMGIIVADRALHRPMNVLICNLAACDLMGGTAVLIRLMMYLATGQKRIAYGEAILQAFSVHTYGAAVQTIMAAMAYDRYLAVCEPLRYHAIMTPSRLLFSCVLAWVVALLCIGVLFALNVGTPLCGTIIKHIYCSNRSILYLACEPTPINDIYGLCMTWSLSTGCFLVIAFSYIKILHACIKNSKDSSMRSKAFQTCASHLVVYVIYQIGSTTVILTQRFTSVSPNLKKFFSILINIIPPAVNPVIYGLVTKELRSSLLKLFKIKVPPRNPSMENYTYNSYTLHLEGLQVTKDTMYPAFIFLLFTYLFIMFVNVGMVVLVCSERTLHQPMYFLFCNLPINDILGNSIMVPRLLTYIFVPPSERFISYYECVVQAFTTHMFGTTSHTILMIMAFDRYVAICVPLRYATIMSNKMVINLTAVAWGIAFICVAVLLSLTVRLNRCRDVIENFYCDNASLFKLSCDSIFINNVYGLTFTVVLFVASIGSVLLTYAKITAVCMSSKSKALNSKALKTCSTHLCLYVLMLISGLLPIVLHRFPQYTHERKIAAILFHIVPSSLNPIIYGLQSTEVRKFLSNGLTSLGETRIMVFYIFLVAYIFILVGNSMIIYMSLTDPKLSSPMYFFLHNLSMVDILYTTVTIPNMLSGLLTKTNTISVHGCFLQMYFFIQLAVTGRAILTVMAYDRYMAICNPLRYTSVMTKPVRCLLIAGAWVFGALFTLPGTAPSWQQTYCGPNVVRHGWCDPSSVRSLVCGDTYFENILSLSFALLALLVTGVLILTSYILIGLSLSKMNTAERLKAFGTCAAHLTVVSISYGSASFVYISYRVGNFPAEVRIVVSVLYTVLTPFLNPVIYSLRNKELRDAIKRTFCRRPSLTPKRPINTVYP